MFGKVGRMQVKMFVHQRKASESSPTKSFLRPGFQWFVFVLLHLGVVGRMPTCQSEHIRQWATPHDRRLGGISRVNPIGLRACTRVSEQAGGVKQGGFLWITSVSNWITTRVKTLNIASLQDLAWNLIYAQSGQRQGHCFTK